MQPLSSMSFILILVSLEYFLISGAVNEQR